MSENENKMLYMILPIQVIMDKKLTRSDLAIFGLVYFCQLNMRDEKCWMSNDTISKKLKMSPKTVSNSVSRLNEQGHVIVRYTDETKRIRLGITSAYPSKLHRISEALNLHNDSKTDGVRSIVSDFKDNSANKGSTKPYNDKYHRFFSDPDEFLSLTRDDIYYVVDRTGFSGEQIQLAAERLFNYYTMGKGINKKFTDGLWVLVSGIKKAKAEGWYKPTGHPKHIDYPQADSPLGDGLIEVWNPDGTVTLVWGLQNRQEMTLIPSEYKRRKKAEYEAELLKFIPPEDR